MKLTLTNKDGEVLEQWDLDEYDLGKAFARSALIAEIVYEIDKQKEKE